MKSIKLKPELPELQHLNEFISTMLKKENLQVNLIVEEIFVNIIDYSKTEFVQVNVEYDNQILTMEFIDNGIEFNPLIKKDPEKPQNIDEAEIGGLGNFLAKKMSDEQDYQYINNENHLKIIKKVE